MPLTSEQAQALTKRRDAGETLTPQEAKDLNAWAIRTISRTLMWIGFLGLQVLFLGRLMEWW
jgi:hypothetical protein